MYSLISRQSSEATRNDGDSLQSKNQKPEDGFIILLHGAPGTGKTETVIAIAEALGIPLLPLTATNENSAKEVKYSLTSSFAFARKWKAILLLDDADIFLQTRSSGDMTQNSIITTFKNALEAYTAGIVVLTTNRVGTFDEAFRSRIHLSLYYAPLTVSTQVRVWKNMLSKIEDLGTYARDEILGAVEEGFGGDKSVSKKMNGWEINDTIKTARQFDLRKGRPLAGNVLRRLCMRRGTNSYLEAVNGGAREDIARERGERNDQFAYGRPETRTATNS